MNMGVVPSDRGFVKFKQIKSDKNIPDPLII